mgnify:CR=1 FL=1
MKASSAITYTSATVLKVNLKDDDTNKLYSITAAMGGMQNNAVEASPYNVNIKQIPLVGETVIMLTADSGESKGKDGGKTYYYLGPLGIQSNVHTNALLGNKIVLSEEDTDAGNTQTGNANVTSNNETADISLGEGFEENESIGSLQPFVGDTLMEGRFGQSIRFGYSPTESDTTQTPTWSSSTVSDPITILSNGRAGGSFNKFIIEDITSDLSSIWLTSSQKVKLETSNKIPSDTDSQSQYNKPSVILNSDRILLNSKTDWVVLSGAKSVAVATPSWAMDMEKMFTILEGLIQQLADLTSAKATYATGVGPTGPATNVSQVAKLLSDLQKMGGGANGGGGGLSPNIGSGKSKSSSKPTQSSQAPAAGSSEWDEPDSETGANDFKEVDEQEQPDGAVGADDTFGKNPMESQRQDDTTDCTDVPKTWDRHTDARIKQLHPSLQCEAANIINETEAAGYKMRMGSGTFRSFADQTKLYNQGRTTAGKKVTNAKAGSSYHNYGLAYDVTYIKNGAAIWDKNSPAYRTHGNIAKKYGWEWGGDWRSFQDMPHVQKVYGKSTRQLLAAVKQTGTKYPTNNTLGIA